MTSDPETQTVQTEYGETSIEVYECDSCGNHVAHKETVRFTLGDREGRACKHCREAGPISFPEKIQQFALPTDDDKTTGIAVYTIFGPLLTPAAFIDAFTSQKDPFAEGYAIATISTTVWVLVAIIILEFAL